MLVAAPVSVTGAQTGLALAAAGVAAGAARRRRLPRTPLDAPLLALLGVTALSAAVSADPATALRKVGSLWVALALYVLVARYRAADDLSRALRLAVPTAVVVGSFGVVQHFTGWLLPGGGGGGLHELVLGGRTVWFPEGGFSHYQTFANVYFMLLCLFAGSAADAAGRRALLPASGALVSAAAVVFSLTRGIWLALASAAAVFVHALPRRAMPLAAALAAAALAAAVAVPAGLGTRLLSAADAGQNVERLLLWETGWAMLRDHPVLGVGVGNFAATQEAYVRAQVPMLMTRTHTHNIWLQAAVERGALGLAAFTWLLAAALGQAGGAVRRLRGSGAAGAGLAAGAAAGLVGFCVDGLVQNNFGDAQAALMFWIAAGTAVVCRGAAQAPAVEARA